jgi:hypothetical protein
MRFLRLVLPALALALAAATAAAPVPPVAAAAPAGRNADRDALTSLADRVVEAGAPGAVIGRRTGEGLLGVARGRADLASGRPAAADDRYRIGSNTKTMVAVVVLQLVQEGRLGLDDSVSQLLPDLGLDERITVRHLLNQTSGFHTDTISTVGDETTFMRALFNGKLLSKRMFAELTTPGPNGTYAMALVKLPLACAPGGFVWGHDGIVFGYLSSAFSTADGTVQAAAVGNAWILAENGTPSSLVTQVGAVAICGEQVTASDVAAVDETREALEQVPGGHISHP